jgi:hypothetical protein
VREESPNGGANRWLIEVCPRLGDEGKVMGKGSFGRFLPFYRQRREGGILVPPIGDSRPMAHQSGWTTVHVGSPAPGSLTGGPRSVFLKPA